MFDVLALTEPLLSRDLIQALVLLVIVGVVLYLVQRIPMDGTIKLVINVVVILAVCLWLLRFAGLY